MAATVLTIGSVNGKPLRSNNSALPGSVPSSAFLGTNLKKVMNFRATTSASKISSKSFKVVAEVDESKNKDKWAGLAYDISDDQQDITRGKGLVDDLFQAPSGSGTHYAVMSSYDYISQGLREYDFDNKMDGFYIAWTR